MRQKDIARLNMVTIKTSVLQALSASPQQLVMEFGHEDLSQRVFTTEAYDHAAQVTLVKYHFWCIFGTRMSTVETFSLSTRPIWH